jgi:hypothetical protein
MPKLRHAPKPKVRWSQETLRRRGVRAVVECMRLNKECQRVRHESADCVQESINLRRYVEKVRGVNQALRALPSYGGRKGVPAREMAMPG